MTRVGVNLLWLVPGVVGGSENHAIASLRALRTHAPDDFEFIIYASASTAQTYPDLAECFRIVTPPMAVTNKGIRVLVESTWLPRRSQRDGVDLLHHLGGLLPYGQVHPSVVTVHDLQPLVFPDHFTRTKRIYLGKMLPRTAARASRIVTLTDFTADMISRLLGVDRKGIEVVPAGVDEVPPPCPDDATRLQGAGVGDGPVFLYPGITYPHKNHLFLLGVFERVLARRPDAQLVLTGRPAESEHEVMLAIDDLSRRLGLPADSPRPVLRLGLVELSLLEALYRRSTAVVFPSTFEGFGMPVLEGMARGRPVVVSNTTALPEVVGAGGLVCDLNDAAQWADQLVCLADDPEVWMKWSTAGRDRSKDFAWPSIVDSLVRIYRQVYREAA